MTAPVKKKKFVVTEVKIRIEPNVSAYLRSSAKKAQLAELLKGVKDMKNWTVEVKANADVSAAYPVVDGHPGHVHGKDWKLNVERGNSTVDRLVLSKRRYTVEANKTKADQMNVKIYAVANVMADTH
jgi:hypothetical protein